MKREKWTEGELGTFFLAVPVEQNENIGHEAVFLVKLETTAFESLLILRGSYDGPPKAVASQFPFRLSKDIWDLPKTGCEAHLFYMTDLADQCPELADRIWDDEAEDFRVADVLGFQLFGDLWQQHLGWFSNSAFNVDLNDEPENGVLRLVFNSLDALTQQTEWRFHQVGEGRCEQETVAVSVPWTSGNLITAWQSPERLGTPEGVHFTE